MITKEKIKIYNYFKGDIDSWARLGSNRQKTIMSDNDWAVIDSLIQDLILVNKDLVSESFHENLKIKLRENCEDVETITQIISLTKET